jgi:hypothetical protein
MSAPVDSWPRVWRVLAAAGSVLDELNRGAMDDAGWHGVVVAHRHLLVEAGSLLSDDLQQELQRLVEPFEGHDLTGAEAAVAQAQLVGWLTGLMEALRVGLMQGEPGADEAAP